MSKAPKLTPTMQAALDSLIEEGRFDRYHGGYWAAPSAKMIEIRGFYGRENIPDPHFGAGTIQALVARGLAHYSKFHQKSRRRYPIQIRPGKDPDAAPGPRAGAGNTAAAPPA